MRETKVIKEKNYILLRSKKNELTYKHTDYVIFIWYSGKSVVFNMYIN